MTENPRAWTTAELREMRDQLFGKPEPETPPLLADDTARGNVVPREGATPTRTPDGPDMVMRRFVRRLLGADENYISMDKPEHIDHTS